MRPFDGRHKWGPANQDGARLSRTCRACGRTETIELLIPNVVLEVLLALLFRPNPYRALFQ